MNMNLFNLPPSQHQQNGKTALLHRQGELSLPPHKAGL
jgi:hypothetical protein